MNNIKIIAFFHEKGKIPFMTYTVKGIKENDQGINLIL